MSEKKTEIVRVPTDFRPEWAELVGWLRAMRPRSQSGPGVLFGAFILGWLELPEDRRLELLARAEGFGFEKLRKATLSEADRLGIAAVESRAAAHPKGSSGKPRQAGGAG